MPILARTAGLIAHLAEEAETPIGFYMASQGRGGDPLTPGPTRESRRMSLIEPDIEAAPWEAPGAADDAALSRQIAYLFERSRFYRDKLGARRIRLAPHRSAASTTSPRCRSPRRTSCARSRSADEPIGTHCTATRDEIVRIYSTSGTTGTPSYIPLTAGDLEVWVRTSARILRAPRA